MKKIISLLLICLMLSGFSVPASAVEQTYGYVAGDAFDDGELNLKDVIVTRRFASGFVLEKDIFLKGADIDGDGAVKANDISAIRELVMGNLTYDGVNVDGRYKVDTVTVGGRNIARYDIVYDSGATLCMTNSASMLRDYINKACGITLNVTENASDERYRIFFSFDTENLYSLGKEGYKIDLLENGDVSVVCGSQRGPLYATVELLEDFLGYRFLPEDEEKNGIVEYLYKAERADLPVGYSVCEIPSFSYRGVAQNGINSSNYYLLRENARDSGHYSSDEKYGYGLGTVFYRAHSFIEQCGIEWNQQPCLTDENTYNQIIDYTFNLLDQRIGWGEIPGVTFSQISCSPNDNSNFCTCSKCKSVYSVEESMAGPVIRLANRVCDTVRAVYPELEIYTAVEGDVKISPKRTKPREEISIDFSTYACANHNFYEVDKCIECGGNIRLSRVNFATEEPFTASNALEIPWLLDWRELTDNLTVWYSSVNYTYYLAPTPNLFNIYYDFRFMAENGITGVLSEGNDYCVQNFELLKGYLCCKMAWNPFMSFEEYNEILNEALMIYYGDGWQYIREYIDMIEECANLQGCTTNNFDRPFNFYNRDYMKEHYNQMTELFDKAYAAATGDCKERVALCRMHCDWLGLSATYERDYVNGDDETRALYGARYASLHKIVKEKDIEICLEEVRNFPSSADKVMAPIEWISQGNKGEWEWDGNRWQ